MGYEKKTINEVIGKLVSREAYLPAIQRKYVWSDSQIARLMDSIMRGYPIGTFLFWNVKKSVIIDKQYTMYDFIKDYHERDRYRNPKAPISVINPEEKVWGVLDGQQRLTSLYISLQGSMSRKIPYKRWNNDEAFPEKELYFNLHSNNQSNEDDIAFIFKFLTKNEALDESDNCIWFLVRDIQRYYSEDDLEKKLIKPKGWSEDVLISENLKLLYKRIKEDKIINYFEIESNSIDEVLDIFVRVNSGGTILSKSDLLFSTIVSHWDNAREEIDKLLSEINKMGEGFEFSNDFIMRTCLYVLDMSVNLKVETFKEKSVQQIKEKWSEIRKAIRETVDLLCKFGFNSENIISYVAITPIVYYVFKGGNIDDKSKMELRKYIVTAQLKQIFGAASNSALTSIREALKKTSLKSFSMDTLKTIRFTGDRYLKFSEDEIDAMFESYEIGAYTFMILSLLYPNLKYSQRIIHQDHMHPQSSFDEDKISGLKLANGKEIDQQKKEDWRRRRNTLANLQLLEAKENEEKNDTPLIDWLKDEENKTNVLFLPSGISYELSNFEEFMEKRQEEMSKKLKGILIQE